MDEEMTDVSKNGYRQFTDEGSELQNSNVFLRNNPFRVATVCLGLLSVLLLVGVAVQGALHQQSGEDHQKKLKALNVEKEGLQENLRAADVKKKVLENHHRELIDRNQFFTKQVDQMKTANNVLTEETNNLKVSQNEFEAKKATLSGEIEQLKASEDQLQTENKAMTKNKELLQKQHTSVIKRKNELHANLDSVTKERDDLQSKISNASRSKDELIASHKDLKKDLAQLEERFTLADAEKGKIASSHVNLTMEKNLLQDAVAVLKKSIAELEKAYQRYVNERRDLKMKCQTEEKEKEKIQYQNNNLTAEKDRLLEEVKRLNTTLDEKRCSNGWRRFENRCYFTSVLKKSWSMARSFCKARGADLATVKTQDHMDFINGLYKGEQEVWIGLTDDGVEGQWKWVDGTSLTTTWWAKGQPNNHKGTDQDCVEFWHRTSGAGEWNDESCTIVQNFICEM